MVAWEELGWQLDEMRAQNGEAVFSITIIGAAE